MNRLLTIFSNLREEPPVTDTAPAFDPFKALAEEGIPVPKPIDLGAEALNRVEGRAEAGEPGVLFLNAEEVARMFDEPQKAVNPKEAQGALKAAVYSVFPRWVAIIVGRVMATGAAKYGKFNYRDTAIAASTYEDAMERHAQLWFDGEDNDPESGVSHLAHVIACATLLLDAQATGKLVDDRQKTGLVNKALAAVAAAHARLGLPESKR